MLKQIPPLSLYIHFPWCVRKCPYCDFNSHAVRTPIPESTYIDALLADLESELPSVWGRRVQTIFMGGGTPSLFSAKAIDRLLAGIRARIPLSPNAEITLEANPGTADSENFYGYRQAGINRLSIGVQSLDDTFLPGLGRIHSAQQAVDAFQLARKAGFNNINLDMMFGLPAQSTTQAQNDLAQLIALQPEHISYYNLTIEPNTLFSHNPPNVPDSDDCATMYEQGIDALARHGYAQYEISAFSKSGSRCAHNLNYWTFGDYLGIGAGAHGKITTGVDGTITRYSKNRHPDAYLKNVATSAAKVDSKAIATDELVFEFMMNALRLSNGFNLELFTLGTGIELQALQPYLEQAQAREFLYITDDKKLCLTERGRMFHNELLELFLG